MIKYFQAMIQKILIIVLVLIFFSSFSLMAEENEAELGLEEADLTARLNLINGFFPLAAVEARQDFLGLVFGYSRLPLSYEGEATTASIRHYGGRLYSPLSYRETDFYLGGGMLSAKIDYQGVTINVRGSKFTAGFERPLIGDNLRWGGELGYLHLPAKELDSQLLFALQIGYQTSISWDPSARAELEEFEYGEWEEGKVPRSISASGSINRTSIPGSVSGRFNIQANLEEGRGRVSVSGDSSHGPFSYSNSGRVRYTGRGVVLTISDSFYDGELLVRGTANITVTSSSFRVRATLRREDGVSASATLSGSTSSFSEEWQ